MEEIINNQASQYNLPTYNSPETAFDTQDTELASAYSEAISHAVGASESNIGNIDRKRVEGFGEATVQSVQNANEAIETYFNPFDTEQLINCGRYIMFLRETAKREAHKD